MATPKFRKSSSKRDMRRAHHALKPAGYSTCKNCGEVRQPHTVCKACGTYKGKQVTASSSNTDFENQDFAPDA